jgi:hypothetical protein
MHVSRDQLRRTQGATIFVVSPRSNARKSVFEQERGSKLRSELDDQLKALSRAGTADKLRCAFKATPESISKAATDARSRKR